MDFAFFLIRAVFVTKKPLLSGGRVSFANLPQLFCVLSDLRGGNGFYLVINLPYRSPSENHGSSNQGGESHHEDEYQ